MITSTRNERVKWIRNLQRKRAMRESEDAFVIEGSHLLQEAREAGSLARIIFYTGTLSPTERALVEPLLEPGTLCEQVSDHVLKACSATESPQSLLAVVSRPKLQAPRTPGLILVLDQIADPGNLGTIMRSARAAGVDVLFVLSGTVDVYNPKVVRAAAGAHFHLPVNQIEVSDLGQALAGIPLWVGDAHRGQEYHCLDWTRPAAIGIGNESHGFSPGLESAAAGYIQIPMRLGSESLNAGVAAAVILFEIARQRGPRCKSER